MSEQLETKDAGEEEMERNNWASQNSQRVVELKKKKFLPIAAIFRLLQFCSKSVIYMSILRGDVEISSSLRVTVSLFGGKCNGQWLNLKFTAETETNNSINYLDVTIHKTPQN